MCGRFALIASAPRLARLLGLIQVPELAPRYNIAPGQALSAVRLAQDHSRRLVSLRWGLVPSWSKTPKPDYRMINAKAETLGQRPAFRAAFRRRRCLIPADGFYEWQRLEGRKQPYYISRRDGEPFAFAGLWERWESTEGEAVESCTIVTTAANDVVAPIHDRMPLILDPAHFEQWLDPSRSDPERLGILLKPYEPAPLQVRAVSTRVNNARNDDPACMQAQPGVSTT